ncbi:MAG: alpha-glucosidase [Alphaproteobacteria bacterium]|nr:alpha-glucosidase [Alphaproteobacteria bacterium]
MDTTAPRNPAQWWKGAVIYQVYPRSYQDSNGDGIGDLAGLTARLPYIASLGVDALWICPFFKSPQRDFGYDVSDYRDIDPLFGSMDDCDRLIAEAHKLGLKIIFDLVFSHTSETHPWFAQSRRKQNGMDDWYVWADPKPDGSPPNNWVSLFGGPAWTFDPMRGQYYLHNFLKEQPDLNFHNPSVQDAILEIVRFWMDRGVDGLRLDVVNFYFHNRNLADNPPRPKELSAATQYDKPDPYNMQRHIHDKSQPENLTFIERMRALTDTYEARFLMGEIGDDYQVKRSAEYTQGHKRLHSAYCFAMLIGLDINLTADYIKSAILEELEASGSQSWPTWAFGNHDMPRAVTRMGSRNVANPDWPKMLMALLLTLRGTICMYQGEELGLTEAVLSFDQLQDPWGKHLWPVWQGRDGCRTPFPWDDGINAGFSPAKPWLPIAPDHTTKNQKTQQTDATSMLHFTMGMATLRKNNAALKTGDIAFLDAPQNLLAYTRKEGKNAFLCVFNLQDTTATLKHDLDVKAGGLANQAVISGGTVTLEAFGFAVVPVASESISRATA